MSSSLFRRASLHGFVLIAMYRCAYRPARGDFTGGLLANVSLYERRWRREPDRQQRGWSAERPHQVRDRRGDLGAGFLGSRGIGSDRLHEPDRRCSCAIDTDGDGNANYSIRVQVSNTPIGGSIDPTNSYTTTVTPFFFECTADSRVDRCGSPSPTSLTTTDMLTLGLITDTARTPNEHRSIFPAGRFPQGHDGSSWKTAQPQICRQVHNPSTFAATRQQAAAGTTRRATALYAPSGLPHDRRHGSQHERYIRVQSEPTQPPTGRHSSRSTVLAPSLTARPLNLGANVNSPINYSLGEVLPPPRGSSGLRHV